VTLTENWQPTYLCPGERLYPFWLSAPTSILVIDVHIGETLEEVSLTGKVAEELKDVIRESYLDTEFESKWRPAKIQLIHNKSLQSVYDGLYIAFLWLPLQ